VRKRTLRIEQSFGITGTNQEKSKIPLLCLPRLSGGEKRGGACALRAESDSNQRWAQDFSAGLNSLRRSSLARDL
jgi:hypothetical protein